MAVSLSLSITQNSQSIANNTSNVTVKATVKWTSGSFNQLQKSGWVKIDGTTYDFTSSFNYSGTTSGSQVIFTKTVNVSHNSDGTKTLSCSASYTTGVSSGTITASTSKVLTTIPRKSTLSVGNGTLGTPQTLTVTEQASSFTHTITAKCGSASTTVCSKSTNNSISFTPPLSWASQNTTGTSVSVTYTITTYNGSTSVGSNTYTKTCSIPASVKPSCTISVTDPTGISDIYGVNGYVKGVSKFKVVVTPTTSYGSAIASYKTTANGGTYTTASFTTDVLATSGELTIKATVTDKRGRSGTSSITVDVRNYSFPSVSKLTVHRCNEDGSPNDEGKCVKVVFDASATDINGTGSSSIYLDYKKTTESQYTTINLVNDQVSVTDFTYIFDADSGSSYNVRVSIEDDLGNTATRATTASTAFTLMHFGASGRCIAFGKLAELEDVADFAFSIMPRHGFRYLTLEPETDLDDIRTPNIYVGENVSTYSYANCPITSGTFTLEVVPGGDNGQVKQILTRCDKYGRNVYERTYYTSSWSDWYGEWKMADLTKAGNFANYYNSGSEAPRYRRVGELVEIRGTVKPTADIAYSTDYTTIFTLPRGYCPSTSVFTLCQGSGHCVWLMRVDTDGNVGLTRYRNGDVSTTATTTVWLPFHCTFLVE